METLKSWITSVNIPKAKVKVSHEYYNQNAEQWQKK